MIRARWQRSAVIALMVIGWLLHFAQVVHFAATPHGPGGDHVCGRGVSAVEHACGCGHHQDGDPRRRQIREEVPGDRLERGAPHHEHCCGWLPPAQMPCGDDRVAEAETAELVAVLVPVRQRAWRTQDRLVLAPKHGPPLAG